MMTVGIWSGQAPSSTLMPPPLMRSCGYLEVGVERCVFWLASEPPEQTLPTLDRLAEIAKSFA